MKTVYMFLFLLLFSTFVQAQDKDKPDKEVPPSPNTAQDTAAIHERIKVHSELGLNSKWHSVRDSLFYSKYNKYGDLRDDDPEYIRKQAWWFIALKITANNILINAVDRYVFKYDYAKVGYSTWKHNIETGWEWDTDRFGLNFFFHPYSGASFFNSARANGYNFYQSIPFAIGGSLEWEYFGENTLPSINDIINTPVSGAFLGEMLYRLSSNILDERLSGKKRFFRELLAAAVDPSRGFSRLTTKKLFRRTQKEIYQKEPLNITLCTGFRKLNEGSSFGTGSSSVTFNLLLDYGNPFEIRSRKPFDYFKLRTDLNFGVGRKTLDNIIGYGILSGKNVQSGSLEMLVGLFQHYDYWDNKTFELGTITFSGGVVSKLPLSKKSDLYTTLHLGIVPLAGNSTRYGPDTSQFRDYNYGGGLQANLESTLELGRRASATFVGYYYWIHTYVGHRGDHFMGIIRPRIEVRFINNLSLGFEHFVYYSDRYPADFHAIHLVRTEQRIFLKVLFEQFKRKE
jgi:hypothetical protein